MLRGVVYLFRSPSHSVARVRTQHRSVKFADLLKYVSKLNFTKFFDTREAVQPKDLDVDRYVVR